MRKPKKNKFFPEKPENQNRMLARLCLQQGTEWAMQGELERAEAAFREAVALYPDYFQAYSNLGLILRGLNRFEEARQCLERAIAINPQDFQAYNNLALVWEDLRQLEEAERCYRQAAAINPECAEVFNNWALVLEELRRYEEAEAAFGRAITLRPDYVEAYYNLGNFLRARRRLEEAELSLGCAVALRPGDKRAELSLALLYLRLERFEEGWEKYERFRLARPSRRAVEIPRWRGEDLTGRSILLFYQQGFGDNMHFIRYAQRVAAMAASVTLWVQPQLARLVAASYPGWRVETGESTPPGEYDYSCAILSLPVIFRTTAADIPRNVPYLRPFDSDAAHWRSVLDEHDGGEGYRIGVVWAGNPGHINDHNRSVPFPLFRCIFAHRPPGRRISWVSLQVGPRAGDLVAAEDPAANWSSELTDFAQTAAVIANLDLVITVDSAVAHLAGAMGKAAWVLIPFDPDWRWRMEGDDNPWYPTLRLFRQPEAGDWQPVLERVGAALDAGAIPLLP